VDVVFVKVGGSFITHKDVPVKLNFQALQTLVKIIHRVRDRVKILLGNGGGSFAHYAVLKYRVEAPQVLLAKCHQATRSLNRIIVDYLVESGIPATAVQTSSIICTGKDGFEVFSKPVKLMLSSGVIPVVYGECILSEDGVHVVSTEKVFELLSRYIRPSRIVLLTDVSGIYTCNPQVCRDAKLIEKITPENIQFVLEVLKSAAISDVTGGVYSKVLSMSTFSFRTGIEVIITSGFDIESAVQAIMGLPPRHGTLISPKSQSSFK